MPPETMPRVFFQTRDWAPTIIELTAQQLLAALQSGAVLTDVDHPHDDEWSILECNQRLAFQVQDGFCVVRYSHAEKSWSATFHAWDDPPRGLTEDDPYEK